jgi:hypothetical protein
VAWGMRRQTNTRGCGDAPPDIYHRENQAVSVPIRIELLQPRPIKHPALRLPSDAPISDLDPRYSLKELSA